MSAKDLPLGLKQRLALACAVMHEPQVLFLDEPTSGVDPITRREFWTHINGLVEKGVTVLVTTHFMDEAEYCDRISLIYRGRSIALGSPDELKAKVATPENPDPTMEDAFIALVEASERIGRKGCRMSRSDRIRRLAHPRPQGGLPDRPRSEQHPDRPRAAASILLFLFGYAVSLDTTRTRIGLVIEDMTPVTQDLAASFQASAYFDVAYGRDRREFEEDLVLGRVRGIVVIPATFAADFAADRNPALQVIVDGSEPNNANFVQNYTQGTVATWAALRRSESMGKAPPITVEQRFWFNPELTSRFFLVPGSIAIVMTLVGTLLTSPRHRP